MNNNANKINEAEDIINSLNGKKNVKIIKNDNGLLERAEYADKIIITEDHRQVLFG